MNRKFWTVTILTLAVLFGVCELAVRQWGFVNNGWYLALFRSDVPKPQLVFIGTSRTAASINTDTLAQMGHPAVNVGYGAASMVEHYMAFRALLEKKPLFLQGKNVFIESTNGLPDPATWKTKWIIRPWTTWAASFMRGSDFRPLWISDQPLEAKLALSTGYLMAWSKLFTFASRVREGVLVTTQAQLGRLLPPSRAIEKESLTNRGHVATRKDQMERVKSVEISMGEIPEKWEATVFHSLASLLQCYGATVYLLDSPLPEKHRAVYQASKKQRATLNAYLKKKQVQLITPKLTLQESDFPDGWHLAKGRVNDFTQAVFTSWQLRRQLPRRRGVASRICLETDSRSNMP